MLQDKNSAISKYLSRLDVWAMAFGVIGTQQSTRRRVRLH